MSHPINNYHSFTLSIVSTQVLRYNHEFYLSITVLIKLDVCYKNMYNYDNIQIPGQISNTRYTYNNKPIGTVVISTQNYVENAIKRHFLYIYHVSLSLIHI